jgi:isocitrate/isopropylmalate dehydrogenase
MIRGMATKIAVLHGDQTGEELLREALRLLEPDVLGLEIEKHDFDLSLEERRKTRNEVVLTAAEALRIFGFGIKAATITPEGAGDVGSPNAILRKQIDGRVIVRTGRRIPGVRPLAGVHSPISVIRMAVDDAYGAKEWREGHSLDEWAFRTEKISRRTSRIVAEYAFEHARRIQAKVFGGPKFTVSPVYEGMFKEELDAAAERHPDVPYDPQLIDATYALLLSTSGESLVIPALNRDGDTLSDLVMKMFGTIAGAESVLLAFDDAGAVTIAMTEAPHGTAPALEGKNVANPMAMILAVASLLGYMQGDKPHQASRAVYESALEAVSDGIRTADLGGHASTTDFTDEVIRRVRTKIDVWSALADVQRQKFTSPPRGEVGAKRREGAADQVLGAGRLIHHLYRRNRPRAELAGDRGEAPDGADRPRSRRHQPRRQRVHHPRPDRQGARLRPAAQTRPGHDLDRRQRPGSRPPDRPVPSLAGDHLRRGGRAQTSVRTRAGHFDPQLVGDPGRPPVRRPGRNPPPHRHLQ